MKLQITSYSCLFHKVIRSCYQQAGKSADADLLQAVKLLSEDVSSLEPLYAQARDYLDEVIIELLKQSLQLPSSTIAEIPCAWLFSCHMYFHYLYVTLIL